MKKLLTFFLTALLTFTVGWAETVTDVITASDLAATGTSYTDFEDVTITSDAVYAGRSAKNSAGAIQLNKTNPQGIVSTVSGGKLKSVTITVSSGSNRIDVYGSTVAYSGSAALFNSTTQGTKVGSVTSTGTITVSGDYEYVGIRAYNAAVYISSISIEWELPTTSSVAAPTFSPDNGTSFVTSQQVTLSAADGATIYYNYDNGSNWNVYSAPLNLTSTTTVYAYAELNGEQSAVAQATYTRTGASTIAEALAFSQGSNFTFTGNAVVTYYNGRYLFIRDNSGSGLIYGSDLGTFSNGDILDPNWTATNTIYANSIPEFTNPSDVSSSSNGGPVAPIDMTATGITTADVNKYVSLSNVTLLWDSSVGYTYVTINGNTVYFRDFFGNGISVTSGKTYDIEGMAYIHNGNAFVYLTQAEEVVSSTPTVWTSESSLTIDDSGTDNSFTIEARSLYAYENVSVTHNGVFNTVLTSGTNSVANWDGVQGFNQVDGSVDGTVTVTYTGRALTATDTYTVGTLGASTTVQVTYVPSLYIVGNYASDWDFSAAGATAMTGNNGIYTATLHDIPANSYILFARQPGVTYNWEGDANRLYIGTVTGGGDFDASYSQSGTLDTDPTNDSPVKYHPIWFPEAGTYTITIDANAGTFTIVKEVHLEGDFTLVTGATQLAAGNEVIIVNSATAGAAKAMSTTQNSNNRGETDVTVSNTLKVTAGDDVQIFTLEGDSEGWYFKTVNGDNQGYIYAASSSSNHLKTQTNKSDNAKAAISIDSDNNIASVVFQGTNTRNVLQHNASSSLFSCYASASQAPVYLYQRTAAASITVNPSSLDLEIPAGETSVDGTVTVTETNTTATTVVTIAGDGASNFSATLNGGTLTVTYSGTATQASPDEATITLTNGDATATVTVTGCKVPLAVTITPADGYTFSSESMTGSIVANNENATIYYSFDGVNFTQYAGSFTAQADNVGDQVTVYAYAVLNGETSETVTATYTRVSKTQTLYQPVTSATQLQAGSKYIIVYDASEPRALYSTGQAQGVLWSGVNIDIEGTTTTVFTLGTTTDGDGYTLSYDDNGTLRYLTNSGRSTAYSESPVALSLLDDDGLGYYVMNGSYYLLYNPQVTVSNDPFRWYTNTSSGSMGYLYVQCEMTQKTLADIESSGKRGDLVSVSDQLIGVWAVNNGTNKYLWAKDQGNVSIDKRPARTASQADYMVQHMQYQHYEWDGGYDWDESNWVILDFAGITDDEPENYVGHKLASMSVTGTYQDAVNYTIRLVGEAPDKVSEQPDAPDYPGYGFHDSANYGTQYAHAYNTYMPANFMDYNLNRMDLEADTVVGAHSGEFALKNMKGQHLYFVNPKVMEVVHLWGVWCGDGSNKFSVYQVAMEDGQTVNAWDLHGAVDVMSWDYNRKGQDLYGEPAGLGTQYAAQDFHAVVVRKATGSSSLKATPANDDSSTEYGIYPFDLPDGGQPTAVNELGNAKQVESVRYYNVMGLGANRPFDGVNIVVTRYSDGSTTAAKVLF